MEDFTVQIAPVNISGPGVLHRQGDDMVHLPERISGRVDGLPWHVTFVAGMSEGDDPIPEIVDLRITQKKAGIGIAPDIMRSLPLKEITVEAFRLGATRYVADGESWVLDPMPVSGHRSSASTRRAHRRVTDDDVREAAEVYVAAKRDKARNPLVLVAKACHFSRPTAVRRIERARKDGLLPPGL